MKQGNEMAECATAIVEEGVRLATDEFRKYLRRMEEVARYDFGPDVEHLHLMQALATSGELRLRSTHSLVTRLFRWVR